MSDIKDTLDGIELLVSKLKAEHPLKRTDLIPAVFNDQEKWVPPGYEGTAHFIWRKMPKSPDNINGKIYLIPESELVHPWFKRA